MDNKDVIDKLIDQIIDGQTTDAGVTVNDILAQKVNDFIELKKIEVAQQIYGVSTEEPVDEPVASTDTEEQQVEEPDEDTATAEE